MSELQVEYNDLSGIELPTAWAVIENFVTEVRKRKVGSAKDPGIGDVAEIVTLRLKEKWSEKRLPTFSHQRIKSKVEKLYKVYRLLVREENLKRKSSLLAQRIAKFKTGTEKLFDISRCKCTKECLCVPALSKTQRLILNELRNPPDTETQQTTEGENEEFVQCRSSDSIQDPAFIPVSPEQRSARGQRSPRKSLPNFAMACDRLDISDRAAALLASTLLFDLGFISQEDQSLVIDRNTVRRERSKHRDELNQQSKNSAVKSLFFDGRKDVTMTIVKTPDGRWRRRIVKEEHIVLLAEPDSRYLGHIIPKSGKAVDVEEAIQDFLEENQLDASGLDGVGGDGTNVNVGEQGGIITIMEQSLQRPLQRLICLLHHNELPLRHLMKKFDGPTSGPTAFSGPIGKDLQCCELMPIRRFRRIRVTLPDIDPEVLSSDQLYLLKIVQAVSSGECSQEFANMKPGPLNHARWLTLACRVLRLYMAKPNPTLRLRKIANYVAQIYAPHWFAVKRNSSCQYGARHLFSLTQLVKSMPRDVRDVVQPIIAKNGHFAHSENILLAMLSDEREEIREDTLLKIGSIRQRMAGGTVPRMRAFTVPPINFEAQDYTTMNATGLDYEPPLTARLSMEELAAFVRSDAQPPWAGIPCHTQAVERCVHVMTQASKAVCGQKQRDGFAKTKMQSRSILPKFETRGDFFKIFKQFS